MDSILKQYKNLLIQKILSKQEVKRIFDVTNMLRYSFTTHLLEQGTDLRYIQELLGYNSLKTIESYTYASKQAIDKIKNPDDCLYMRSW